jgi:hypothetical protein
MSKIITKRQLNTLIESTLKEYVRDEDAIYAMPGGEEFMNKMDQEYNPNSPSEYHRDIDKKNQEAEKNKANTNEDYMEDKTCSECGGVIKEGLCESGCGSQMEEGSYMKEDELEEGNAFSGALETARKEGKTEFEFNGKTYPVEGEDKVKESVKDLAESVTKTFNPSFLTENMDNFNKLINYRNK